MSDQPPGGGGAADGDDAKPLRELRNEPHRRFFFCHLQKTAGTSLFIALKRAFGPNEIYPNETDGDLVTVAPQLDVPVLLDRWAERGDRIRMVTGHFPYCTREMLDARFTTFTVLREPVERTLSYLRHHRKLTPEDRDKTLEEIYEDPFRFRGLVHNHMVKMFSLTTETMTAGMLTNVDFTPWHLEEAKRQLATVDHVGIQEDFEAFWNELRDTHGWNLGEMGFANRTGRDADDEVSDEFRARILEDNALDVAFYEHALELVAERKAARSR